MKIFRTLPRLEDVTDVLMKNPKLLLNEKNNYTAEKFNKNFLSLFFIILFCFTKTYDAFR